MSENKRQVIKYHASAGINIYKRVYEYQFICQSVADSLPGSTKTDRLNEPTI